MLENILQKIIKNLQFENSGIDSKSVLEFLELFDYGEYIYPTVFSIDIGLPIKESYRILEGLTREKVLERNYEIYCQCCNKSQGEGGILDSPSMAGDKVCVHCEREIDRLKDLILIYKVIWCE